MKVNPDQPFEIIYALYEHQYVGFLFESFAVQLNDHGKLTLTHQNISSKNAREFDSKLSKDDYELIDTLDAMQHEVIAKRFSRKKLKPSEFFLNTYNTKTGDNILQKEINNYLDKKKSKIMPLLLGKNVFEMGADGEPTFKRINVLPELASILFHFRKNEDNTHYFPTIKLRDTPLEFRNQNSHVISNEPSWLMVNNTLFTFKDPISGSKLKPFLKKKFILIPKNLEETYYRKFVAPLVASHDVYAKGFNIVTQSFEPMPILTLSKIKEAHTAPSLFNQKTNQNCELLIELKYQYGSHKFKADILHKVNVSLEKNQEKYTFFRIKRNTEKETELLNFLLKNDLPIKNSRIILSESKAFDWLNQHQSSLKKHAFIIQQNSTDDKKYFLGPSEISINIEEKIDWFDIKAIIKFGDYEIPFLEIRNLITNGQNKVPLPNGQIGVIPASWAEQYKDLFMFSEPIKGKSRLQKYHVALVQNLKEEQNARVTMSRRLKNLINFTKIEDQKLPSGFKGELRPYQKAGFNWMLFLNEFNFGACLADDMGLGKTIQTLALLQHEHEINGQSTSLLIMPTSLIYNWHMEAKRFTPSLKVLIYTGSDRIKKAEHFMQYDLIITSYGISRIDTAKVLSKCYFNYIVLDESQAIKNPNSLISVEVKKLNARKKLILTGTPIENSTLDLWSQLSFVNPGLLGNKKKFTSEYQIPIEKHQDVGKTLRLNNLIKPFILRREKSQVAKDLPEKTVSVRYCSLTEKQKDYYESEKSLFRNEILNAIENEGIKKSQIILLKGLTHLRQIANHPIMVNENYDGDSGKLEEIIYMLHNALGKNHNILVFSQFVKHLKIISNHLEKEKIPFAYLDGSVKDRQGEVEKFQNNPSINVFLISLKAGGLGLNLTKADYVFLLDPWWNPAAEAQAIDRAHRIGQKNKVFTYKFISKDTLEEKILQLQESKKKLAADLISIEESFVKSLSKSDIQNLFD